MPQTSLLARVLRLRLQHIMHQGWNSASAEDAHHTAAQLLRSQAVMKTVNQSPAICSWHSRSCKLAQVCKGSW